MRSLLNIPSQVTEVGNEDLQMVNITCRVLSRPDMRFLPEIYRTLGADYDERVLPSIVNEVLKSVVAQFNASQIITQRENVRNSSMPVNARSLKTSPIGLKIGQRKSDETCESFQSGLG